MKKVLLWGITPVYEACHAWLQGLDAQNEIKILAVIDDLKSENFQDGYKIIRKEEIGSFEYDQIIITAGGGYQGVYEGCRGAASGF